MLAGVLVWWHVHVPMSACERADRSGDPQRIVQVCRESYEQSKDDRDLARTANGYMQMGEIDKAEGLAHRLLAHQLFPGPLLGEAHRILSYAALRGGSASGAKTHAEIAYVVHTLAGDDRGRARDAVALAEAAWQAGDYTASLNAADEARTLFLQLGAPDFERRAQLVRAHVLRRVGDFGGAIDAATHALDRATLPCDQARAHYEVGMGWLESQQPALAMSELADARQADLRGHCGLATVVAFNEVPLLRSKDPKAALARLEEVEASEGKSFETLLYRGYLAADRWALADAEEYFSRAEHLDAPDADWDWELARSRAEVAELRGGASGDLVAESYYRHAIASIAALRATNGARSAYLVASHRGPYDGLISLLARQGRWPDVLEVVLKLDASDMLRATADERLGRDLDHPSPDIETSPPGADTMASASVEGVLSAWQARDLVIVIAPSPRQIQPGHERAYRLRIRHGQVTGEDVGDAAIARKLAGNLFAHPEDEAAARALGPMIVPPGPDRGTLYVLAPGALGRVPLPALRDEDGSLLSVRRPPVRVLGLLENGPESRGTGPASIIADPRGDLPSAALEGLIVRDALGAGANAAGTYTSVPATRERLWSAADASLLHIAGHVVGHGRWRALSLADGDVDPSELVRRRLAPRIAVLAGCGSAAAQDEEGWGSIAQAFLESGTAWVIATDRTVDDLDSLILMHDFYNQPDRFTDPARALARVQQAHAIIAPAEASTSYLAQALVKVQLAYAGKLKARSWAAFSVLARPPAVPARTAP